MRVDRNVCLWLIRLEVARQVHKGEPTHVEPEAVKDLDRRLEDLIERLRCSAPRLREVPLRQSHACVGQLASILCVIVRIVERVNVAREDQRALLNLISGLFFSLDVQDEVCKGRIFRVEPL